MMISSIELGVGERDWVDFIDAGDWRSVAEMASSMTWGALH